MVKGRKNIQFPGGDVPDAGKPDEKPKKPTKFKHDYECTFKSVSIAKDKSSVGLSIPRKALNVEDADEVFCGAQLAVMLEADPNAAKKESSGQGKLVESTIEFEGVATCGGYGVKADVINLSLQFVKSEVYLRQLGRFAALKGKVKCTRTGNFAGSEGDEE